MDKITPSLIKRVSPAENCSVDEKCLDMQDTRCMVKNDEFVEPCSILITEDCNCWSQSFIVMTYLEKYMCGIEYF